jgi:DNA-binding beta-propeller fold protein YncE
VGRGGFDHAAVHARARRLYVAHTANDALDVIDVDTDRYLRSIPNLKGVAGALISDTDDLVFTSNRGEDTVALLEMGAVARVPVGRGPNGLAFDPDRRILLAANVGEPPSVSLIDVREAREVARLPMPGRTRWTVFDPVRHVFFVNIADPARIGIVESAAPYRISGFFDVPAAGPHGLDLDPVARRLYCACDAGVLICLDADSGAILAQRPLSGPPDVLFLDPEPRLLYVAIGDPGVIDVCEAESLERLETVSTEPGAHTLAFDPASHKVYVFLPQTSRVAVFLPAGVPA